MVLLFQGCTFIPKGCRGSQSALNEVQGREAVPLNSLNEERVPSHAEKNIVDVGPGCGEGDLGCGGGEVGCGEGDLGCSRSEVG